MKKNIFIVFFLISIILMSCKGGYSYGGYLFFESKSISDGLIFAGYDVDESTIISDKELYVPSNFYGKKVVAIGNQTYISENVLSDNSASGWVSLRGLTRNFDGYGYHNHVTGIGYDNNIDKIVIPSSIQIIHSSAFRNCSNIKTVYIYSENPPTGNGSLPVTNNLKIYVPTESVEKYKNSSSWLQYKAHIFAIE